MSLPDTHLDLGCGTRPRNPYGRQRLFGVDIREVASRPDFESRAGNLVLDPIPYADNSFGSVSAFDFIEHVPRLLPTASGTGTRFPFIELMNEVWRVLAPGGRFHAVTPAYPHVEAFMDPTHVNIITEGTHTYFTGDAPYGRMYGFTGHFRLVRCTWVRHHHLDHLSEDVEPEVAVHRREQESLRQPKRRVVYAIRETIRFLRGKRGWVRDEDRKTHLLWEFEAVKG